MRIWVDCTAAAHPLVLRPIIERLRAARARGRDHGARVRPDESASSSGSGSSTRSSAATAAAPAPAKGVGASRGAAGRSRAGPAAAGFDLALAHGSVDLAVVATALRIPSVQMQDYEYAGLQRQLAFRAASRVLVPDAIAGRGDAPRRRRGAQALPLPRAQGGLLPRRLRARRRRCSASLGSTGTACSPSSARRPRPPPITPRNPLYERGARPARRRRADAPRS